ncbi:integrin alpha-5-like isoform X3 [Apis florea]|uniref:integrin alpha-5-like isoform X3 n=1 Tax=Apis florea TaxID=7463 RepID=UPI0012FED523|nr:integrin alpha-5-like isoform X3 [Apis florea]
MTVELPLNDDLSQFEINYYLQVELQVGIINPASNISIITKLYGTHIGEYFGASLAVGDLNRDGLDDLLIGAPYWGEDTGRVYIYFGTSKEQFEIAVILHGVAEGGHFGYAIASGDLDADGFDDIIVGTPWEDDGVIYVFNGTPDLKNTNFLQNSQRIEAVKLFKYNSSQRILRFGFSISKPIDIDKNGYLDIAIGAYKSEHAIILRSKPIWKTELFIETIPNTLQRDAKQFLVRICPRYNMYGTLHDNVTDTIKFRITAIIDERYQRTKETILEMKSSNLSICLSSQVNILKDIRDFIEPISIVAKHDFLHDDVSNEFCKYCPIEKHNKIQNIKVLLPFNIGCGDDKICNSNISATAKFYNVRYNNMWIIGSNDISLKINLKNYGEPAYLTTLEFIFPERVILRSILPSCQEDISKENLIVICDIGNPIWKEEEKNVKLDLDMRYLINGSLYDHKLYFYITIKTRSINHGMTSIIKTLNLVNEVSLSLHGKANEEIYYLTSLNEIAQNVIFQHTYQVYKLGASPIEIAQLIVKVPLAIKDLHLIYMYKSQLYISGELFECSSESSLLDIQREPSLDQFDISLFSNKIRKNNNHLINEKDQFNSIESALYLNNMNIKAPKILNENWTNDIIYMNCSTPYINCITIVCDLNTLKTLQDIGKMTIKLFLNVNKFKDIFRNNRAILKYATEVSAEIIKPDKRLYINGTRSTMEIVTIFYNIPKMEKLQPWIVLISILIGILLLLIFAAILGTLGFFKRKKKTKFNKSKM